MREEVNSIVNAKVKNKKDKKEFLTKVARLVDPANKQFSDEEKMYLNKKASEIWLDDAEHVIDIMAMKYHLTSDTAENFHTDAIIRMLERFYRYNNPAYMEDDSTEFEITTYIKRVAQDVLTDSFADAYGMKPWHYKEFRAVMKAEEYFSSQYMGKVEISEDLIYDYLNGKISKKSIVTYLHMLNGVCSIEEQVTLGIEPTADEHKFCTESEAVRTMKLDSYNKKRFDSVLKKFSRLDFYIILGRKGLLDGELEDMTIPEFVETSDFKKYFAEDISIKPGSDPKRIVTNKIQNKIASLEKLGLDNEEDITELVMYMKERLEG